MFPLWRHLAEFLPSWAPVDQVNRSFLLNIKHLLFGEIIGSTSKPRYLIVFRCSLSVGKTTLLDMIANGQVRNLGKDKGEILLNGFPVKQYGSVSRRLFGYVAQKNGT